MKKIFDLFSKIKKKNIYAVYEDDLNGLLQSVGIKDSLELGKENCHVCGTQVTYKSLRAIIKVDNEYKVVCYNQDCINSITNK